MLQRATSSDVDFAALFDRLPAPVVVRELGGGEFVAVNRAFEDAIGYARAEIVGKRPEDLGLLKPLTDDEHYLSRVVSAGRVEAPIALRRKDGRIVDAIFDATLTDLAGKTYLIVVLHGLAAR